MEQRAYYTVIDTKTTPSEDEDIEGVALVFLREVSIEDHIKLDDFGVDALVLVEPYRVKFY
jgi:hypothetical protein